MYHLSRGRAKSAITTADRTRSLTTANNFVLPTVGLRDAEDLLTMLGFARFAEGSAPLAELEDYLAGCVRKMLDDGNGRGGAA